jgi:hypothetical protein
VLFVSRTTVAGNEACSGGGILSYIPGAVIDSSSVVDNGSFANGAGVYANGSLTVTNSTISDNAAEAPWGGGGIFVVGNGSVLTVNSSTITANSAGTGGGIYLGGGVQSSTVLRNTILANNAAADSPDCRAPFVSPTLSAGHNLVGTTLGCSYVAGTGDLTGVDPLLGPLQDNGGPTASRAPLPGSPAIDAGDPSGCTDQAGNLLTADQRGVPRPQGPACDIGAVEVAVQVATRDTTPPVLSVSGDISVDATSASGAVVTFVVTATDDVDPSPSVACTPPSGSTFPIGTTSVTCTATDAAGNAASASFAVHVRGAREQLLNLLRLVDDEGAGSGKSLHAKLAAALRLLDAGENSAVCGTLKAFLNSVRAQTGRTLTSAQAAELTADALRIRTVISC